MKANMCCSLSQLLLPGNYKGSHVRGRCLPGVPQDRHNDDANDGDVPDLLPLGQDHEVNLQKLVVPP